MTHELQRYSAALSTGSLGSYIHWTNQIPILTEQEEQNLALKLLEFNDLEAARRLVMAHLRFVVKLARGYLGYGLPLADLIQEGNIGLMKAVKRFDPKKGVRLVSFAVHWIRAEIHEFVIRNWRIVKVATTKAQRKLFFNLRKMSEKMGWLSKAEVEAVAEELKVKPEEVRHMESRLSAPDESFDAPQDMPEDELFMAPSQYLEDQRPNPEHQLTASNWMESQEIRLQVALETLDERSQHILRTRWLDTHKLTLQDLAAKYHISAERVRQLEQQAMKKLREQLAE
ncbi:MAG TPA: RNA polymerase sigma factor RpoH [Coxiellaceae bacterium]|nr:RNA polymerase sigma factor RpoH [Coxiellaceae bacterium]